LRGPERVLGGGPGPDFGRGPGDREGRGPNRANRCLTRQCRGPRSNQGEGYHEGRRGPSLDYSSPPGEPVTPAATPLSGVASLHRFAGIHALIAEDALGIGVVGRLAVGGLLGAGAFAGFVPRAVEKAVLVRDAVVVLEAIGIGRSAGALDRTADAPVADVAARGLVVAGGAGGGVGARAGGRAGGARCSARSGRAAGAEATCAAGAAGAPRAAAGPAPTSTPGAGGAGALGAAAASC
jgi:hypothetical protein